jgi:dTDP-4-dehydrorhamnose reductase
VTVLVTGATGLLGAYLVEAARRAEVDAAFVGLTSLPQDPARGWHRCDLTDEREVSELWERVRPSVVVHAAALTNVDLCEREPELADRVNRRTAELLARHARTDGARVVLVSTDSVFDGRRGAYTERDEPAPVNIYARSKLEAEREVASVDDHLVVRTNFFGRSARGSGLAEWLLGRLEAREEIVGFTDVVFSPLPCNDVAELVLELALGDARGLLHLGAADAVSKLEFAQVVAEAYGFGGAAIRPGQLADAGLGAPRPLDTSLDSRLAATLVGGLSTVEEGVRRMVSLPFAAAADR